MVVEMFADQRGWSSKSRDIEEAIHRSLDSREHSNWDVRQWEKVGIRHDRFSNSTDINCILVFDESLVLDLYIYKKQEASVLLQFCWRQVAHPVNRTELIALYRYT